MSKRDERDYPREQYSSERSLMGRYIGKGPRNYNRSDKRIAEEINERLTQHHMIDASEIEVSCQNGEVTITGIVENRQMKRTAEDITDEVWGVRDVHNQIRIKQRLNEDRNDRIA